MGKPIQLIKDAAQDKLGWSFQFWEIHRRRTTNMSELSLILTCTVLFVIRSAKGSWKAEPWLARFLELRPVKKTSLETGPHILTRFEALPRVRLVDSSSLLTAGLLELTQIPVGGVICSTDRLDVGRTALDTLTVRFILPHNAMAMEWTKVDITWSCWNMKI